MTLIEALQPIYYPTMRDIKELELVIDSWKNEHRPVLPINIDSWTIQLRDNNEPVNSAPKMKSGKYMSSPSFSLPFYKSFSRVINLKLNEEPSPAP